VGQERRVSVKGEDVSKGKVVAAVGNLVHIAFEGEVSQGEVAFLHLGDISLQCEILEVADGIAKAQVFDETYGVRKGMDVSFERCLLEAELGPGLLGSIFDGLQNPLKSIAEEHGYFIERGCRFPSLDRKKKWTFKPLAEQGEWTEKGQTLGEVKEGRFRHCIMTPFSLPASEKWTRYRVKSIAAEGRYSVEDGIAIVEDAEGNEFSVSLMQKWPIKNPLMFGERLLPIDPIQTGMRIVDTQFPVLKGGTFCIPGPFGAGKTVLQHQLSKHSSVDIVIVCACGERAGEVVETLETFPQLNDPHTGETLMQRTVLLCNTSSMPVAAREASIYMGLTLGEYYRQMGYDVLLLADSTSRWAQALREMSGRLEEIPGEEAFPAYLASRVSAFYERGGLIQSACGHQGSLTIGGTVSPAGGNFEEPVTQATLASVGSFWGLSRDRANARKYPAIDPLISWSKYGSIVHQQMDQQWDEWSLYVQQALSLMKESCEIEQRKEVVGEEGLSIGDLLTWCKGQLYDACYLQQKGFDPVDAYCPMERQIGLSKLMQKSFALSVSVPVERDSVRTFFLELEHQIRNLNTIEMSSELYKQKYDDIRNVIEKCKGEWGGARCV